MKKFVVSLLALSLALPVTFAQTNVATGTFSGTVGGMCVVKSPNYTGTLTSAGTGNTDSDGFATRLAGTADFSFKSNAPCSSFSQASNFTGPQSGTVPLRGSCDANITGSKLGTPTVIGSNSDAVNTPVYAELTRGDYFPLLAGSYSMKCTTTLTAGVN